MLGDAFRDVETVLVPPERAARGVFQAEGYVEPRLSRGAARRVVYGNLIHKRLQQTFYAFLEPDEFVFFDNGISSYWEHDADINSLFGALNLPSPSMAYLTLDLPVPKYLAAFPARRLALADYEPIYAGMRRAAVPTAPLRDDVIIGSSLFRTGRISWEDERAIYLRLAEKLDRPVAFKAHPRAADRPLVTSDDGFQVIESGIPIEALVQQGQIGAAYSISSTSLFTLASFFGWRAHCIETAATAEVMRASPHLALSQRMPRISV